MQTQMGQNRNHKGAARTYIHYRKILQEKKIKELTKMIKKNGDGHQKRAESESVEGTANRQHQLSSNLTFSI